MQTLFGEHAILLLIPVEFRLETGAGGGHRWSGNLTLQLLSRGTRPPMAMIHLQANANHQDHDHIQDDMPQHGPTKRNKVDIVQASANLSRNKGSPGCLLAPLNWS